MSYQKFPFQKIFLISPYSARMRGNAGKNTDQNNSKYRNFLRRGCIRKIATERLILKATAKGTTISR